MHRDTGGHLDIGPGGSTTTTALTAVAVPSVTVIVPTRHEPHNVAPLVARIDQALGAMAVEIVFVDDSDDETPDRVREAAATTRRQVTLLHRPPGERHDGLSGAVIAGMRVARAPWVVVMDGDLQHPPELVPGMLRRAEETGAALVVASRRVGDGDASGLASRRRSLVSAAATRVTRLAFPRRLAEVSDPMSGFFAVRLDAVDLDGLRPRGFKILLEVVLRGRPVPTAEVAFHFGPRSSGQSKASAREGAHFVRQVLALRVAPLRPAPAAAAWLRRAVAFGAVGTSGIGVNLALLWLLAGPSGLHLHYLLAAAFATQGSTLWNFALTEALVFRTSRGQRLRRRLLSFFALNNAALLLRLPVMALLVDGAHVGYLLANVLTLALVFLLRFHVSDRYIYRPEPAVKMSSPSAVLPVSGPGEEPASPPIDAVPAGRRPAVKVLLDLSEAEPAAPRRGTGYLPYRYDVGGLVTIGSQVVLRELEYFRAPWLGKGLDIEVRIGDVGRGRVLPRATLTRMATPNRICFSEQLGRLGANFQVEVGDRIEVTAAPLLGRSPHVLYTNVLEALLRFVLVHRDRMLLHSACVELDGRGLMLSAKTDTGKTGTVLRLLREKGARFLSDDMTVLSADAIASCFPKPLTISHHTLRAVDPGDLSSREWRRLKLQSRLHSKEGRQWGMALGDLNVPLMSLNAITQWLVPPPKYAVDRLVPAEVIRSVPVEDLFIIERGTPQTSEVDTATALQELIENTDDAYGFPPFRYFAPALVLGTDDYLELRRKESLILAGALTKLRCRRTASDCFGWADDIPALLGDEAAQRPAASLQVVEQRRSTRDRRAAVRPVSV